MAVIPITPEQFNRVQAELREQMQESAPVVKNQEGVRSLTLPGTFRYRGVAYLARPVGYLAGVELQEISLRCQELSAEAQSGAMLREVRALIGKLPPIFHAHAVPVSRWRRWLRPLLGNPFRRMTEEEAGMLLGFFSACRMRSSVQFDVVSRASDQSPT